MTELHADLGERLRAAREQASLSQEELAGLLELSVRSLQDYEAKRSVPRPTRRRQILAFIAEHEAAA